MAGLAWYYLLAADAQRGRGGLRLLHGDGLRGGLARRACAPRPGGCPTGWSIAFFGLYGLAIAADPRPARCSPRATDGRLRASVPWPTSCWRSPPGPTPPTSPRSTTHGHGEGVRGRPPEPRRPHAGRRPRQADQPDALDADLGRRRRDLPGDGHRLHARRRGRHCRSSSATPIDFVSGPDDVLRRRDARLHRDDRLPPVRRQRPGRLGDRQPVPALLRPEHDRLRLPRHRHQARQRADRRADRPGRLLHLARPAPGRDQRRADGARACPTSKSSSPRRR